MSWVESSNASYKQRSENVPYAFNTPQLNRKQNRQNWAVTCRKYGNELDTNVLGWLEN